METITFIYKDKIEQFKEQFPELYLEIYNVGYTDGRATEQYQYDAENPAEFDEGMGPDEPNYFTKYNDNYPQYAEPADNSERFYSYDDWEIVYKKAQDLEFEGYKAGNTDWEKCMSMHKYRDHMFIVWNPTHKQFVVESDIGVVNELYPHLVNAKKND